MNMNMNKMANEDLTSRLPDDILVHVLSFLDTKYAVATSAISKRWNLLWTFVPNFEFNFYTWPISSLRKGQKAHYEDFVARVLSRNNAVSVRTVKFHSCGTNLHRTLAWCKSLVMRDAERYDFNFSSGLHYSTPLSLFSDAFFNKKRLVELKLNYVVLEVPPLVSFPCLKTMELVLVEFPDEESMKSLLRGCTTLTDLCIHHRVKVSSKQLLHICSSTLQSLEIHTQDHDEVYTNEVVIDTPNLRRLLLKEERGSATYDMINISSLVHASLSYDSKKPNEALLNLLKMLSHAREFFFNHCSFINFFGVIELVEGIQLFSKGNCFTKAPMFPKLIHLTLEAEITELLAFLPCLLELIPSAETIVFKMLKQYPYPSWNEPLDLPDSILSRIESVECTEEKGQAMPVISCVMKNIAELKFKKLSFHGLPIHVVQEDKFLETVFTAKYVKCRCASLLGACFPGRDLCSRGVSQTLFNDCEKI